MAKTITGQRVDTGKTGKSDKVSIRIKAIRAEKGISQTEVAEKIGIERSNYNRMEKRGEKMTYDLLEKIAQALGVSVMELVSDYAGDRAEHDLRQKRLEEQEDRVRDKQALLDLQEKSIQTVAQYIELTLLRMASVCWYGEPGSDPWDNYRNYKMIGPGVQEFPYQQETFTLFNKIYSGAEIVLIALYANIAEKAFFNLVIKLSEVNLIDRDKLYIRAFTYVRNTPDIYSSSFEAPFKSIREKEIEEEKALQQLKDRLANLNEEPSPNYHGKTDNPPGDPASADQ